MTKGLKLGKPAMGAHISIHQAGVQIVKSEQDLLVKQEKETAMLLGELKRKGFEPKLQLKEQK